jgi:hypothetical protein
MNLPIKIGISPTLKIRCLFAAKELKKGEVIERCPVILVDIKDEPHLEATALKNYYFEWNSKYNAVALGYGSLYNHSYEANANFSLDFKNKQIVFKAVKDIKEGEEIFINYNGEPLSTKKLQASYLEADHIYNPIEK